MRKDTVLACGFFLACSLLICGPARAEEAHYQPVIAGPWQELFLPERSGTYINDHCVYQDPKGDWHLIGITSMGKPRIGTNEKWFAHGVTSSLTTPMRELEPLFKGWPDDGQKWAPHTVWDGSTLHLFAGPGKIRHFTSRDGYSFEFAGYAIADRWRWLRDTMVLKMDDGSWLMYATDRVDKHDVVTAFRSMDLYHWEYAGVAFTATKPAPVWAPLPNSACESPFVIRMDDGYYLSVCLTNYPLNRDPSVYLNTLVFFSEDPLDFGVYQAGWPDETARLVARFDTHAAEYILDPQGNWWITCSGWLGWPRPKGCEGGQACIAELKWERIASSR
ncbi:MAG TPA: hypothetical protein VM658_20245 [bacterium]|nr:hypothetical protein [bacterium]